MTAWDALLHLASIAFTIIVLTLCFTRTYFEDITRPNVNSILNAFQFVAALHGILIAISLSSMASYHLTYTLIRGKGGATFGHLVATLQIGSIVALSSSSFWASIFGRTAGARRRIFGLFIFVATWLAILIPPFSAVLLVPQLRWWVMDDPFAGQGGFFYLNASSDRIWPEQINKSMIPAKCVFDSLDMGSACPYAGYAQIRKWSAAYASELLDPNITQFADANMMRYLGSTKNALDYNGPNHDGWSAATTGMAHLTRDLGNLYTYAVRHNILNPLSKHVGRPKLSLLSSDNLQSIQRPLVQTQCGMPKDITAYRDDMYRVDFPIDRLRLLSKSPSKLPVSKQVNISSIKGGSPKVTFVDLADADNAHYAGILIGLDYFNGNLTSLNSYNASALIACTTIAHFIPTVMSSEPKTDNVATIDNPDPYFIVNSTDLMKQAKQISLSHEYLNATNPQIGGRRGKVHEYNLQPLAAQSSGVGKPYLYDGSWNSSWPWVVSTVMSMQIVDALARVQYHGNDNKMMTLCEKCASGTVILDLAKQNTGWRQEHVDYHTVEFKSTLEATRAGGYLPLTIKAERYGYGWIIQDASEWAAAVVLMLHSALVLGHVALALGRGWRSEEYRTTEKMLVLANESKPINDLASETTLVIQHGVLKAYI